MNEPNFVAGKNNLNFNSVVEAIIKRSCIVDFGIIQKVTAGGIVEVAVAVADTPQNVFYMSCVLINTASSSLTVKVTPHVGDRVLVVYPRMYDDTMFSVPDGDKKTEVIVNTKATGYNLSSGLAILMNQYKKASHKNVLTADNGVIEYKCGDNSITFDLSANGKVSISDSNGCTYETSSEGTVINGKLKVKK